DDPRGHRGTRRVGPDTVGRAPRTERERDICRFERDDGGRGGGADGQGGRAGVLYAFLKPAVMMTGRVWLRLSAVRTELVPRAGPLLLASNHSSLLDPPLIGSVLPRELDYMAKTELFRIPGLGRLIRKLNAHPVDRSGSDSSALRLALRLLGGGRAVLVFPE